jgi:hypothetical protein
LHAHALGLAPGAAREALRWGLPRRCKISVALGLAPALHEKRCAGACPGATPVASLCHAWTCDVPSHSEFGHKHRTGPPRHGMGKCQPSATGQARVAAKVIRVGSDFSGIGTFNIALKKVLFKLPVGKYTQENMFCSDNDTACEAILKQTCAPNLFSRMSRAGQSQICHQRTCSLSLLPRIRSPRPGNRTASMTRQALVPWHVTRWFTYLT